MTTAIRVINLGLSKISASRVTDIAPPRTSLERFAADNYPHYKRWELTKRTWRFSLSREDLTQTGDALTDDPKPYGYQMPNDCLRPIRKKNQDWEQRGRLLFSAQTTLRLDFVAEKTEDQFDPLFEEVLACKFAMESAEYVTQLESKKLFAEKQYDKALREAAKLNAFIAGSQPTSQDGDYPGDDPAYTWTSDRYSAQG